MEEAFPKVIFWDSLFYRRAMITVDSPQSLFIEVGGNRCDIR